ncbi:multiple C2 and transmembrane domain-containing protein 2-like isoform X1 [Oncorhynchus keta]|uniref:multiple C2 and transmembrane domain-containing protein 2-like isoform X1 n=1 Tax=Oncorhynchus keta TaxID=8018 RepID=UPI0015FCB41D|nr:multiple C2 and transmembrane domain-containing protein 2-like isoform X1 [Oncorhynchus keta]
MGPKKKSVWENLREKTKTQFNNIKKKTTPGKLDEKKPKPLRYRRSMSVPDLRMSAPVETQTLYDESEEEDMATFMGRIHMPSDKWNTPAERSTSSASSTSAEREKIPADRGNPPVPTPKSNAPNIYVCTTRLTSSVEGINVSTERLLFSEDRVAARDRDRLNIPPDRWSLPVNRADRMGTPADSMDGSARGTPLEKEPYMFCPTDSEDLDMPEPPVSTYIRDIFCRELQEDIELPNEHNDFYAQPLQDQAGNNAMAAGSQPGPIQKYLLTVNLKEGRNLVIRDRHGTSDPYVKFKLEGKTFYKSKVVHKNLNPKWSESFSFPLQDWEQVVDVRVYDKDRTTDEFMGSSTIVIKNLELDKTSEMVLSLEDPSSLEDDMGVIVIDTCLTFRDATIKRPKRHLKNRRRFRGGQNQKGDQPQDKDQTQGSAEATNMSQLWSGVFGITLLEGQDMPEYGQGDVYVRYRLGEQKYKSKNLRIQANPRWREKFDFNKYENWLEPLNVEVFVKRGRKSEESWGMFEVDLSKLPVNTQQLYTQTLDPGKGRLILLVTFNPCSEASISDINKPPLEQPDERDQILEKYSLKNSHKGVKEVGFLQVKVFNATDLTSTDLNGKSDPFCVLELGNSRLQTHTIYKTLSPEWNKVFTFPVKDIHDVLELKVFDEDGDKAPDFLGRVAIPLLSVQNGQQVTRGLKNENLRGPAKGTISLVMEVHYNPVRAGIKTFRPKEEKFMEDNRKFSKKVLAQNIYRVRKITLAVLHTLQYIKSCFQWESTQRSVIAFLTFMVMVWTWELFMMPIFLLLLIGWNYFQVTPGRVSSNQDLTNMNMTDDEEEDEKESGKKGLMEKIHMVQEIIITVQNILDEIACIGERVKNTFNWSVPFLSCLACLVLFVATAALYYIPLRYIIFIWGINKFTKKLRNPYAIDNNEILDFIKRVPSDVQKVQYSELRAPSVQSPPRRRR